MGLHEGIREELLKSFKHRSTNDQCCAICGATEKPLAFHVLQYAQSEQENLPDAFVPMSASRGTIRGCFPVCDTCAPPCRKCGLPIVTKRVRVFYNRTCANLPKKTHSLLYGNGVCKTHLHPMLIFGDLFSSGLVKIKKKPLAGKKELAVPTDSIDPRGIWRHMRSSQVDIYQNCLNEIFMAIDVDKKSGGTNPFTEREGDSIMKIANQYIDKSGIWFLYIETMLELYIDADSMIRQIHKSHWVKKVTGYDLPPHMSFYENDFFPQPSIVMEDVKRRFFS
jgi:hypothetical protein